MNGLRQNLIPSKPYTHNDEWQGSSPCKFKPVGIKIVPQILHESKQDGGRMHYYINKESTVDKSFKPGKKIFNERYSCSPENSPKPGIKRINPSYIETKVYPRHRIVNPNTIRKEEVSSIKQFPSKWINMNKEYQIDWNKKKRISNLTSVRNGIEIVSPCDKIYKTVEYSPDYFNSEGWVVGSSNTINYNKHSAQKTGFYNSLDFSIKLLNNDNNYITKENRMHENYDKHYVSNILQKFDNLLYKK
jgi:hypothetical protein